MVEVSGSTFYRRASEDLVFLLVETPNTADSGDTVSVDLGSYGIAEDGLLWIMGCEHTTDNSVIVTTAPTTSVSGGTLTITIGGSNSNNIYTFLVIGRSKA